VAHSARYWSAHHTWQTRFFNEPSVKHWYTGAFFLGRTSTYLHLVILVGVRGDWTRNPWVGSRVFYHWAKSPHCVISLRSCLVYIQILINDIVTRSSIISRWQIFTRFVNTRRDWAIIVVWNATRTAFRTPPKERREIDFEWCINLNVWKLVLGPGNDIEGLKLSNN